MGAGREGLERAGGLAAGQLLECGRLGQPLGFFDRTATIRARPGKRLTRYAFVADPEALRERAPELAAELLQHLRGPAP
jgi:hypothetical protein